MYAVFDGAKSSILTSILGHVLPYETRHEATAVIKSAKLSKPSKEEVLQFLEKQVFDRSSDAAVELSELARQHILVEWFTNDICATVRARRRLDTQVDIEPFELSFNGRIRIQRALYRLQLYCNLFSPRNLQRLEDYDARDAFFTRFPAWEVEEFACIHDYLHRRLDVIDEITLHDLETLFRYERISNDFRDINLNMEYCISLGLEFLHSVFAAQNYEQRRVLFSNNIGTDYDGIASVVDLYYDSDSLPLDVVQHQTDLSHTIGPSPGWMWSIENDLTPDLDSYPLYYIRGRADLREWCYCFWDEPKLNAWHAMDVAWTKEPYQAWVSA
ncbi:hypothetical protein MMC17_009879 [Xylographa soralifera]|nr:hypothetical protein [Xylographa soralifera]